MLSSRRHRLALALLAGALVVACGRGRRDPAPPAVAVPPRDSPPGPEMPPAGAAGPDASIAARPRPEGRRARAFDERVDERESLVRGLVREGIHDPAVVRAMRTVPRHAFVLPGFGLLAYVDRALPIVGRQTISQPYVVAFMTQAVEPTPSSRCLEIGTGSGYQGAVLAEICEHTYSIEYLPEVARFGEKNLRELGYGPDRVSLRVGDGYAGWPEAAPFDAIVVTAAPERVPAPLLDQLAMKGKLVIPVGPEGEVQALELWTRLRAGRDEDAFRRERLLSVQFVPFAGKGGAR